MALGNRRLTFCSCQEQQVQKSNVEVIIAYARTLEADCRYCECSVSCSFVRGHGVGKCWTSYKRLLVFVYGDDCVILSNASGQVNAEKNR